MNEINEEQVTEQETQTYNLYNLFEGNLGLAVTYWVYGVLGGIVWVVGIFALNPDPQLIEVVWLFFVFYYFFVYVGIWRAATKYNGNKVWAILAKFAIIITVLPITIYFLKWLASNY